MSNRAKRVIYDAIGGGRSIVGLLWINSEWFVSRAQNDPLTVPRQYALRSLRDRPLRLALRAIHFPRKRGQKTQMRARLSLRAEIASGDFDCPSTLKGRGGRGSSRFDLITRRVNDACAIETGACWGADTECVGAPKNPATSS